MAITLDPITSPCQDCGAIVGAAELHAGWHARLAAAAPPMTAQVTVLDPGTGAAVEPSPDLLEALAAAAAPVDVVVDTIPVAVEATDLPVEA